MFTIKDGLSVEFKDRLKEAREDAGLTQGELAKKIGKTQAAIQSLESGRVQSTSEILKIADILEVSPYWLYYGKGDKKNVSIEKIGKVEYKLLPVLNDQEVIALSQGSIQEVINKSTRMLAVMSNYINIDENTLSYQVTSDAMVSHDAPKSSIFEDEFVIIQKDKEPRSGDKVLAVVDEVDVKIRQYIKDGNEKWLKAFNKSYDRIKIDGSVKILGVVIGKQAIEIF